MAGTAFPRARTLLQSFDSAKFQDAERISIYTAHARSEVLSAMLFGHEIVIPAGVVADSSAFITLLNEVMEPASGRLARLKDRAGHRYSPFRIGLEPRFAREKRGFTGYDAFVDDYVRTFKVGRSAFVRIAELARRSGFKEPDVMLPLVGKAFLEGKWKEIERVDPDYGHHIGHVFNLFSARNATAAVPIYAKLNAFTYGPSRLFLDGAVEFEARLIRRKIDFPGLGRMIAAFTAAQAEIANPRRRGEWYRQSGQFGDNWMMARVWLDQILYQRMIDSYDIAIPSLLQQPILDDPVSHQVALAFLSDEAFAELGSTAKMQRIEPIQLESAPWAEIWDMILDPGFQRNLNAMHRECHRCGLVAQRKLAPLQGTRNASALRNAIRLDFRKGVRDAVAAHVDFLGKGSQSFVFEQAGNGMLRAHLKRRRRFGLDDEVKRKRAALALGAIADIGISTATGDWPLTATATLCFADRFLLGGRLDKGLDYLVRRVALAQQDPNMAKVVDRGQKLVNLWASPQ